MSLSEELELLEEEESLPALITLGRLINVLGSLLTEVSERRGIDFDFCSGIVPPPDFFDVWDKMGFTAFAELRFLLADDFLDFLLESELELELLLLSLFLDLAGFVSF